MGLPSGLFPSGFSTKTLPITLLSPIHATCPAYLKNSKSFENKIFAPHLSRPEICPLDIQWNQKCYVKRVIKHISHQAFLFLLENQYMRRAGRYFALVLTFTSNLSVRLLAVRKQTLQR
jgi:hypothetical protein